MNQSHENEFTPSVSRLKYLELNFFGLRFFVRGKSVYRYIAPSSFCNVYQIEKCISNCRLYFQGIQKTESLILKVDVISKIFRASSCNFSLFLRLFTIKLPAKLSVYQETTSLLKFRIFRGFQRVMNRF